jgi:hypothetical protein
MMRARALATLLALALAGCVTTSCPQSTAQAPPPALGFSTPRPHGERMKLVRVTRGFYRSVSGVTVYYVRPPHDACAVVSMDQMQAYGGFAQVRVVPSLDFLAGYRLPMPACPWPEKR